MISLPDKDVIRKKMRLTAVFKRDGYSAVTYVNPEDGEQCSLIWCKRRGPPVESIVLSLWRMELDRFAKIHGLQEYMRLVSHNGRRARVVGYSEDAKRVEIVVYAGDPPERIFVEPSELSPLPED